MFLRVKPNTFQKYSYISQFSLCIFHVVHVFRFLFRTLQMKKSRKVLVVKMTIFLYKNLHVGPRWTKGGV